MTKLEEMKKNHNFKIETLKLKGQLEIEEMNIKNDLILNKLMAEKNQLKTSEEIRKLKIDLSKDKKIIKSGQFILIWGLIITFVSSILTISGLWDNFNHNKLALLSFISIIILTQFTVYILSKNMSNIKNNYSNHLLTTNVLRYSLLTVSIYGNYTFFTANRDLSIFANLIIFVLCLCIDFISIQCVSIGYDFKYLNKSKDNSKDNSKEFKDRFKDIKEKTNNDIKDNLKVIKGYKEDEIKQIENNEIDKKIKDIISLAKNKNIIPSNDKFKDIKIIAKRNSKDIENNSINIAKNKIKGYKDDSKDNTKDKFQFVVSKIKKMKSDEMINLKTLDKSLNEYELKKLRNYLKDNNLIYIKGKRSYKTSNN